MALTAHNENLPFEVAKRLPGQYFGHSVAGVCAA